MSSRDLLLEALSDAGRASGASAVMLHMAISERLGLGAADSKTYDMLLRRGPLTAGEIGRATGLSSGSVTALIDRLEGAGYVRRTRNESDRRKVVVHANPAMMEAFIPLMSDFVRQIEALNATYDDNTLNVLTDYIQRVSVLAEAALGSIKDVPDR